MFNFCLIKKQRGKARIETISEFQWLEADLKSQTLQYHVSRGSFSKKKAKWQKGIILTIKLLVDKGASPFIKLLVDKGATGFRGIFLLIVNYVGWWCNGIRL